MKKFILYVGIAAFALFSNSAFVSAQKPTEKPSTTESDSTKKKNGKKEPKTFVNFMKDAEEGHKGLFNIYTQDEKYYFEIPDSIMNRDIIVVNRISRSGVDLRTGFSGYAGDQINENVIRYEKGPNNKVFMKKISYSERSKDSTQAMYTTVMNSNIQPIAASFDIVAFGPEKNSVIVDMTSFINDDNDIFFFSPRYKQVLRLGSIKKDMSYIDTVKSFPTNTEIRTVKPTVVLPHKVFQDLPLLLCQAEQQP